MNTDQTKYAKPNIVPANTSFYFVTYDEIENNSSDRFDLFAPSANSIW